MKMLLLEILHECGSYIGSYPALAISTAIHGNAEGDFHSNSKINPKSFIRLTHGNVLLLLYGLFVRFAFLFAVLLPVPSRHSPLCLRRNGCNTTEIKTERSEI